MSDQGRSERIARLVQERGIHRWRRSSKVESLERFLEPGEEVVDEPRTWGVRQPEWVNPE